MRLASLAALLSLACARPRSTERVPALVALSRLHDALERGELTGAVDPEPLARAEFLERMAMMHDIQVDHEPNPTSATADGWRRALADINASYGLARLHREFDGARALLGDGRCAELSRTPLPEALAHVAEVRSSWPTFVNEEVRAPVVRRAAGARSGVFRCTGANKAFRAVLVPREPDDGSLVVARITPD